MSHEGHDRDIPAAHIESGGKAVLYLWHAELLPGETLLKKFSLQNHRKMIDLEEKY